MRWQIPMYPPTYLATYQFMVNVSLIFCSAVDVHNHRCVEEFWWIIACFFSIIPTYGIIPKSSDYKFDILLQNMVITILIHSLSIQFHVINRKKVVSVDVHRLKIEFIIHFSCKKKSLNASNSNDSSLFFRFFVNFCAFRCFELRVKFRINCLTFMQR